ncbi:MAG: DUF3617 domain-containing protein [Pseudomonadota bacterium]
MRGFPVSFSCVVLMAMPLLAAAEAEKSMRPGMWEVTTTSELLKLASQIPPEQITNLRALAKQYGLEVPEINGGSATAKICVTPEMAQRNIMPELNQRYAGCESSNANRFGDHYSVDIRCESQQIRGKGSASGVFTTAENFVGKSSFDGVVQGMPVTQQAETRGRWVAATCPADLGGSDRKDSTQQNPTQRR